MISIKPNFSREWTLQQVKSMFPNFNYQGDGWYNGNYYLGTQNQILVYHLKNDLYCFDIYYNKDPKETFAAIAALPTFDY